MFPIVSRFENVKTTRPSDELPIDKILSQNFPIEIKNDIKKIRDLPLDEYKKQREGLIPLFTTSGVFDPRNNRGLKRHSRLVCLDVDRLGDRVDTFKEKASRISFVFAAEKSLRGDGVKVFCKIDKPTTKENHSGVYKLLSKEIFPESQVDAASALSQLCYFSLDENIYLNPFCDSFPIPETLPEKDCPQNKTFPETSETDLQFLDVDSTEVKKTLKYLYNERGDKFTKLMDGKSQGEDKALSSVDFSICLKAFFYLKSESFKTDKNIAFSIANQILRKSKSTWFKKSKRYKLLTLNKAWNDTQGTYKDNFSEIQRDRQSLSALKRRENNIEKIQWAICLCEELNIKPNIKNISKHSGISRQHTSKILKMLP